MIKKCLMIVLAVVLFITHAEAVTLEGQCDIRFFGQSTLHNFEGKGACQQFTLNSEKAASGAETLRAPIISVLVKDMDTDNSGRDQKMQAMFESDRFPTIQGKFQDLAIDAVLQQLKEGGSTPGQLDFDLQIRETSKTVAATTRDLQVTPEQISFRMEFPLSLADFQLKPPSVLGMIRVADQVRVEVTVVLSRQ